MLSEKGAELSHAVRKAESYEREVIIILSTDRRVCKENQAVRKTPDASGWVVVGRFDEGFLMISGFWGRDSFVGVGDQNTFKYDERISLSTEYKYLEQLQARKLKYKLEDVRRRGRREEGGRVNEQLVSSISIMSDGM